MPSRRQPTGPATVTQASEIDEIRLRVGEGLAGAVAKNGEVINLVVSQVNECLYCLSAHTALGKMNGFSDEQILEIRSGQASFDAKLDALAKFTQSITLRRGKPSAESLEQLFAAGYSQANLIDIFIVIGDKIISNFLHGTTQIPIDFPVAQPLETVHA